MFKKRRKVTNLFKNTNTKIAFRANNTVYQQLVQKTNSVNPSGIYEIKYNTCSKNYETCMLLYMLQAVPPPIIRSTKLCIQRQVFSNQYCCLLLSTIAAGSSIGMTIPDAVCTVLCSWWWAEEPPETCRAIYRNK